MMLSNYEITKNKMRQKFTEYDQEKMIKKFSLKYDSDYLYITMMCRLYRIGRKTGMVEWSDDGFITAYEADFDESMTIYDILCYSKDDCCLSGNYCSVNMLKGTVKTSGAGVGENCYQKYADELCGKSDKLLSVCNAFGEKVKMSGDVAVKIYPFSFLPVIIQYWEADDEFPANLKFMFDENILQYMHYETTYYLVNHIIKRIFEAM